MNQNNIMKTSDILSLIRDYMAGYWSDNEFLRELRKAAAMLQDEPELEDHYL